MVAVVSATERAVLCVLLQSRPGNRKQHRPSLLHMLHCFNYFELPIKTCAMTKRWDDTASTQWPPLYDDSSPSSTSRPLATQYQIA